MPTGRRSRPCRCGRGGAGRGWVGGSGCQAAGGAGVASPATAAARHAACALGIPPNTLTHIARHAMRAALAPLQPAPPPYSSPSLGEEELEGHSSEIRVDLVFCVRQVHQLAHLALHGGVQASVCNGCEWLGGGGKGAGARGGPPVLDRPPPPPTPQLPTYPTPPTHEPWAARRTARTPDRPAAPRRRCSARAPLP